MSAVVDGRPVAAELRDGQVIPLVGITEVGPETPTDVLATAQRDVQRAVRLEDARLRPLVPAPRRILCVGLNYASHVEETKRGDSDYPVLFPKFASALLPPDGVIELPAESHQIDYEGELAVIIGRAGRRISEAGALGHILGVAAANDVTMRDFQYKTHQWVQGKAWDASTPLGPAIVTLDEVDLDSAGIRTILNGIEVQNSDLGKLIFSIPRLIAVISTFTALEPGDIILTGTPGGVGFRRDPQVFLHNGDQVEVEIEGVGRISNLAVG
ncbi:fumarylacetoacetate hydrolase family protein [Microbacterium sp. RD1]|uniref:fumarylacetoacetate hydrolase family protein n=1 Tax=Microbacterium sp. RD1 TaxID=3457313 RepID=UPI003FA60779